MIKEKIINIAFLLGVGVSTVIIIFQMAYLFVTKEWFAFQKLIGKHDYYIIVKPSGEQPAPCGNVITEEVIKWTTFIQQRNNPDARQGVDLSLGLGQGLDQGPDDGRDQGLVAMPADGHGQQRDGLGGGGGGGRDGLGGGGERDGPGEGGSRGRDGLGGGGGRNGLGGDGAGGRDVLGGGDELDVLGGGDDDHRDRDVTAPGHVPPHHQDPVPVEHQGNPASPPPLDNNRNAPNLNLRVPVAPSNPAVTPAFNNKVLYSVIYT